MIGRSLGVSDGRLWLSRIICPKQFGVRPESTLRSLPRRIWQWRPSLLAHALLFCGVQDSVPGASSSSNQSQNIPARSFATKLGSGLIAVFTAILRASSLASNFAAARRPGSSSE